MTHVSVWPRRRLRKTAAAWVRRGFWEVESLALFRALFFKGKEIFLKRSGHVGCGKGAQFAARRAPACCWVVLSPRCTARVAAVALLPGVPPVPFVALSSHLPGRLGTAGSARTARLHWLS